MRWQLILLLATLICPTGAFAAFRTLSELAHELETVSGKFSLISETSREKLQTIELERVAKSHILTALEAAQNEMESAEVFEKVLPEAISVTGSSGEPLGHIIFPMTFLAVPEGDTDYYVVYYVFVSADGKQEDLFKVFSPLY